MSNIESIVNCPSCRGLKKLIGLGTLMKECEECKGIGSIKEVTTSLVKQNISIEIDEKPSINEIFNKELDKSLKMNELEKKSEDGNFEDVKNSDISIEVKKRGRPRKDA